MSRLPAKTVKQRFAIAAVMGAGLLAACVPGPSRGALDADGRAPQSASIQNRTLVIAMPDEPVSIANKPIRDTSGSSWNETRGLFNAGFVINDGRGVPTARLVEALPEVNTDSWRVFPDGRMETSYRLRPNLIWHDGTAASAEDFVFAWRVYTTRELGTAGSLPQRLMEEVVAPDPRTVVIRWRQPFPEAGTLTVEEFQALPRHILEQPFLQGEPEAFVAHPFWSYQYVGLGPYRLERWEPGAFLEGAAFDGYVLGPPKIARIRLLPIPDRSTVLANLLAEAAHSTIDNSINFTELYVLHREWSPRNGGAVLWTSNTLRYTEIQFKPEVVNPQAMLDLRVRKALAHGIDKEALNQGILEGQSRAADHLISPQLDYFPAVDQAVIKYPYDPRRVEQLVLEAGFFRGPDGFFTSPTEGRFAPELLVTDSAQYEQEASIILDAWKRAGIDGRQRILPQQQSQDPQLRASFPAMGTRSSSADPRSMRNLSADQIPRAENRWAGNNRGGWVNPEYERLFTAFNATLGQAERTQYLVQAMKVVTEDVTGFFLYYSLRGNAYAAGLRGPTATGPASHSTWNVHEWDWA